MRVACLTASCRRDGRTPSPRGHHARSRCGRVVQQPLSRVFLERKTRPLGSGGHLLPSSDTVRRRMEGRFIRLLPQLSPFDTFLGVIPHPGKASTNPAVAGLVDQS